MDLPDRADVAVIGAGLAGLAVAQRLATAGVDCAVVDERHALSAGASGRHIGVWVEGLAEAPHRLIAALGEEAAAEIQHWAEAGRVVLEDLVPGGTAGILRVPSDAADADAVAADHAALKTMGTACEMWPPDRAEEALGRTPSHPCLWRPTVRSLNPQLATQTLRDRLLSAGARLCLGHRVTAVEVDGDHLRIVTPHASLCAEVVVYAANAWLPGLEPWFVDKITPVREAAVAMPHHPALRHAVSAGRGYTTLRPTDEHLLVSGARWATPHLEVGETEEAPSPKVVEALVRIGRDWLGDPAAIPSHAWAWIVAHTCDGLPLVGPLPGSGRMYACCGFGGNQPGLGVAAAYSLATGLLTGRPDRLPTCLSPMRQV